MASSDYSLSDIQKALNEKKQKQAQQQKMIAEHYAREMPVKHVSEEDKKFQIVEQRLTAISNRVENLMGLSGRVSLIESQANTLVSGIGHNALGGSQGSGIVNIADADDTYIQDISHGETIRWDESLQKFVPAQSGAGTAGTLQQTMELGDSTDITMRFENNSGIIFNEQRVADNNGFLEWRTERDSQGGLIKSETFENNASGAEVIKLDTRYDKDNGGGIYIESTFENGGSVGGTTLSGFDARTIDPYIPTLAKRIINAETLVNTLTSYGLKSYGSMVNKKEYGFCRDNPGSFHTDRIETLISIKKIGFNTLEEDGTDRFPTIEARHPVGSYLLIEKEAGNGHGLYQVTGVAYSGNDLVVNLDVTHLQSRGAIRINDRANVYALSPNSNLDDLRFLLDQLDDKVDIAGDEMTGPLIINNGDKLTNPTSFQIRGLQADGGAGNWVFSAYESGGKDLVAYRGPITNDKEITTKEYVDNKVDSITTLLHPGRRYELAPSAVAVSTGRAYITQASGPDYTLDLNEIDLDNVKMSPPAVKIDTALIKTQMLTIYNKNFSIWKTFEIGDVFRSTVEPELWTFHLVQDSINVPAQPNAGENIYIVCPFW